jgi:hypothetical protein
VTSKREAAWPLLAYVRNSPHHLIPAKLSLVPDLSKLVGTYASQSHCYVGADGKEVVPAPHRCGCADWFHKVCKANSFTVGSAATFGKGGFNFDIARKHICERAAGALVSQFREVDTTTGVHTGIMVALVPVHPSHLATHLEVHEDTVVVSLHPHTPAGSKVSTAPATVANPTGPSTAGRSGDELYDGNARLRPAKGTNRCGWRPRQYEKRLLVAPCRV